MADKPYDIRQAVIRRRDAAVKFRDGQPSQDRKEALQFYNGTNLALYGDSGAGLSTVVSRDTMEAIESMMPPLLRPFVAGEEVVSFDPVEEKDKDATQQATDYVNSVFTRHNCALDVVQTSLKDGLLLRLGIAKTVMEEEDGTPENFAGMNLAELQALHVKNQGEGRQFVGDVEQDEGGFNATVSPKKRKCFRVYIIAPDEFLYEERLPSLKAATFLGHSRNITVGELIEMGIDVKKAKALHAGKPGDVADERFRDEQADSNELPTDDLARIVQVDECYIKCDCEGEGVLEWRKVLLGGQQSTLLSDEPADDHPYSVWTPIPVPHKLTGLGIYDLTRDVQMQKTAITREALNAIYLMNRPQRQVLDGKVNIDDLMKPALDGVVRVKELGAIAPIPTGSQNILANSLQFIEYLDGVRESRTGVTRYNQGMDANSLNKTATGMNIIASNSQQRQELVARQFGEFLKDIFEKLLALVSQHADQADVERLTNKPFVPWPTDYDTTVSVGLGNNNKDQLVGHIQMLLQTDAQIVQLQGGVQGPILTAENIYEKLKVLVSSMGIKNSQFYTDPAQAQQQLPQPEQPPVDPLGEAKIHAATEIQKEDMRQHGAMAREVVKTRADQPQVVPFPVAVPQ